MVALSSFTKTKRLFKQAKAVLVGGVNSPVRSFAYAGGNPLLLSRGIGSKVYDYDGNAHIDYVLSWGSLILGHAYPPVVKEACAVAQRGLSFGTTNEGEVLLARHIQKAIPFIKKIRFVTSGTEAVMGAIRLARGVTKRDIILKFEHAYHGHADYLLQRAGSGVATLRIPAASGVPQDFLAHTRSAPLGDIEAVKRMFRTEGKKIAAVIVEPVGGNYGVIPPDIGFLKELKRLTKQVGALLIFDEVITGFRFHCGSAAQLWGITPDLICLGKIIGAGLPIGAYGGRDEVMRHLAPLGEVYQASTFSGNPVVMSAGIATLKALKKQSAAYGRIKALTEMLSKRLVAEARLTGVDLQVRYFGSMFSLKFSRLEDFRKFYRYLCEAGIFLAPSEFEANFLSFAHTKGDIEKTISAAISAFHKLSRVKTKRKGK